MKKYIAAAFLAVMLVTPFASSALTIEEVKEQIQRLLAQISALQEQLRVLQSTNTATSTDPTSPYAKPFSKHRVCNILLPNLSQGSQGEDVRELQGFLTTEGHFNAQATGYYGPVTANAVASWQTGQGVTPIGAFGPQSRERLKLWCGGNANLQASPTRGEAPLTVNFYTRLSGFHPNTIYHTLDFGDGASERAANCPAPADACTGPGVNTHTYTQNGTYVATLNKVSDRCPDDGDPNTPRCLAPIHSEVIGKVQIHVGTIACTLEYNPVCGAKPIVCITTPCNPIPTTYGNKCAMEADGAKFLYAGECKDNYPNPADDPQCKRWDDGKWCGAKCSRETPGGPPICAIPACLFEGAIPPDGSARCIEYFGNSSNKPPVISGFSGPTVLKVNETGTWIVKASDPENGPLSYRVTWGDELFGISPLVSAAREGLPATQVTTFTHAYTSKGLYTVTVVASDNRGQEAKTSTTVRVDSAPVVCTTEYNPVCGRPAGCVDTCTSGQCPAICQLHTPQTYSNRCNLDAAGATYLHTGVCTGTSDNWY